MVVYAVLCHFIYFEGQVACFKFSVQYSQVHEEQASTWVIISSTISFYSFRYSMSAIPIFPETFSKDNVHPIVKLVRQNEGGILDGYTATRKVFLFPFSHTGGDVGRRQHFICPTAELGKKAKMGNREDAFCTAHSRRYIMLHPAMQGPISQRVYNMDTPAKSHSTGGVQKDKSSKELHGAGASTNEKQLKSLDAYFSKLSRTSRKEWNRTNHAVSQLRDSMKKSVEANSELKTKKGIGSLDSYFNKLDMGGQSSKKSFFSSNEETRKGNEESALSTSRKHNGRNEGRIRNSNNYLPLKTKNDENDLLPNAGKNVQDLQQDDESSDLYLISILASINIAVFFFEIASPMRDSDMGRLSLPLMYGAKINELILDGEWWRLVTPMFLHSGFLHVALGCWVLLTFGPQVCRGYGSFTFFLIYILGGISGNLSSFVHTPEATVGGTGPIFAILGAWFIYQIQNKDTNPKEVENMFQKAVIVTVLSLVLSNFEHIDDWTHLGAACAGLVFGLLTCPILELGNASSKNSREDGMALIRQQASPCKSTFIFLIFILVLSSVIFLYRSQVEMLEIDSFE